MLSETGAMTRLQDNLALVPTGVAHSREPAQDRVQDRDVPAIVGANLRSLRRAQGYSLEKLADISKVSRAMLGQIETGKSVPTITVLWKIADALQVPLGRLLHVDETPTHRVSRRPEHPDEAASGFQRRTIFEPLNAISSQLCEVRLEPGHREVVRTGVYGRSITLVVAEGVLLVSVSDDTSVHLREGDAIQFDSQGSYTIENLAASPAYAFTVASQG